MVKKTGIRKEAGITRSDESKASSVKETEASESAAQPSATTRTSLIHVQNKKFSSSCSGQQPAKKRRKYDPCYLSYGFTIINYQNVNNND